MPPSPDPANGARAADAIPSAVLHDLRAALLLHDLGVSVAPTADQATIDSRAGGALLGLAVADAVDSDSRRIRPRRPVDRAFINAWALSASSGSPDAVPSTAAATARVTAVTQLAVLSAEAWATDAPRGPIAVAEALRSRAAGLRFPSRAVRHASIELESGTDWMSAASPSYGDAALPRAAGVGIAMAGDAARAGIAGSLDAMVTHRSPGATTCSAIVASLVAAWIRMPASSDWRAIASEVIGKVGHPPTRDRLLAVLDGPPASHRPIPPHATDALAVALQALSAGDDLSAVIERAHAISGGNQSATCTAGALFGAIHGDDDDLIRSSRVEGADHFRMLTRTLVTGLGGVSDPSGDGETPSADLWLLLDRSGSMRAIERTVVEEVDAFFVDQRSMRGNATVTLVQFDSDDPHDVIHNGVPIEQVGSIEDRFEPRGLTPLYDAIGLMLDRAERRGGMPADKLVVIVTDGLENASTRHDSTTIFRRIGRLRSLGWTFVFLGANQDSYSTADRISVAHGSTRNFRADRDGVAEARHDLSRRVGAWRGKSHADRRQDADHFWVEDHGVTR